MTSSLSETLNLFFQDYRDVEKQCRLFVFREDGLMQYQSRQVDTKTSSSCGALMGGTWQAAMTLMSFTRRNPKSADNFRLSFDSSSEGVHILNTTKFENYDLFLGAIFVGQKNPAQLKNKLKNINFKLRACIDNFSKSRKASDKQENYLFSNISDSEIDEMFSVVEN